MERRGGTRISLRRYTQITQNKFSELKKNYIKIMKKKSSLYNMKEINKNLKKQDYLSISVYVYV